MPNGAFFSVACFGGIYHFAVTLGQNERGVVYNYFEMKIVNRKFEREFEEIESYEAGIVLTGAEVKSIRAGGLRLDESYVKLLDGVPYLINAEVPKYQFAALKDYDPKRSRRLLLHNKELLKIRGKLSRGSGLTMAPVFCYNKGKLIKFKIAIVRGRRDLEKRKLEKRRDIKRSQQKEAKEYMKR